MPAANDGGLAVPEGIVYRPREFAGDGREKVVTLFRFDLPFALIGLEGILPDTLFLDQPIAVLASVGARQVQRKEVATALRASRLLPATPGPDDTRLASLDAMLRSAGTLIGHRDYTGTVNRSTVTFRISRYVPSDQADRWFLKCIGWTNRIISLYRAATMDYGLRKVRSDEIVVYQMAHELATQCFNVVVRPAGALRLESREDFPDDPLLHGYLWLHAQIPKKQPYHDLIEEAEHYVAIRDYRIATVLAIAALESVLTEDDGTSVKALFDRRGLPPERVPSDEVLESVGKTLAALDAAAADLRLGELANRVKEHYARRTAVLHHGTPRLKTLQAQRCVEDVRALCAHLLDSRQLSIVVRLTYAATPPDDATFPILALKSPTCQFALSYSSGKIIAALAAGDGEEKTMDFDIEGSGLMVGEAATIAVIYDDNGRKLGLALGTELVDELEAVSLDVGPQERLKPVGTDDAHEDFFPLRMILLNNRAIAPADLVDVESVVKRREDAQDEQA